MNRAELIGHLRSEHDAMEQAIAGLTPEQLGDPGATPDGRSVKDILAHIAAWEAEMVTALYHASLGRNPSITRALQDVDRWNAERRQENAGRPAERVLADWRGVRRALIHRVQGWDEDELNCELSWRPGRTLVDMLEANSFAHEAEHRAEIERWRQRVQG